MKTILVDAWRTFITDEGMFEEMKQLLDSYENEKIILTSATEEQRQKLGIVDMPYPVFSLSHDPEKQDPLYYKTMLEHFSLTPEEAVYFEHNEEAVETARSVGITAHHYDKDAKNLKALKNFLDNNL